MNVVYKILQFIKSSLLDAVSIAGIVLLCLSAMEDKPLDIMVAHWNKFVFITIIMFVGAFFAKACSSYSETGKWLWIEGISKGVTLFILWLVVTYGVLSGSEESQAYEQSVKNVESLQQLFMAHANSQAEARMEINEKIKELENALSELRLQQAESTNK